MTASSVSAVLWGPTDPLAFLPTVRSLLAGAPDLVVTVGGPDTGLLGSRADVLHAAGALVDTRSLAEIVAGEDGHVLVALRPVLTPPGLLDAASGILEDPRVGTLSFWCNDASFLSFPHRNTPASHQIGELDEQTITERLRGIPPAAAAVPIPGAVGPVAILGQAALAALGGMEVLSSDEVDAAIFVHSMRAQRRGFLCLLDPSTYVAAPYDLAPPGDDPSTDAIVRGRLTAHSPPVLAVLDRDRTSITTPLATVHDSARAKVLGLHVLIDGTCLGPKEMGTQVHTLNLVRALAAHPEVARLEVTHATDIPEYAARILSAPAVHPVRVRDDQDVMGASRADIAHRPYQPDRVMQSAWRDIAARTVVTVQDLIAYRNGAYHASPEAWLGYRDGMRSSLSLCDGVVVISDDVREEVERELLPVPADRLFVVPCGTDHLTGGEATEVPPVLVRLGAVAAPFVLVVGANYAHKNRDLAIGAVRELRRRGFADLRLVLVGAAVPFGSSRVEESVAHDPVIDDWCISVLDVPSKQRNWLLRHAALVLYPTAAEGFGLVPFEAARFGTPVVTVPFGPLVEAMPDAPVSSRDWDPHSFADAAGQLLTDPDLAAAQVAAATATGEQYTWDRTAAGLIAAYRLILGTPRR